MVGMFGIAPGQHIVGDYHTNASAHGAEKVEADEALGSPDSFKLGAEHPERQHVPYDVTEAAVQKSVRDELPDEKYLTTSAGMSWKSNRSGRSIRAS